MIEMLIKCTLAIQERRSIHDCIDLMKITQDSYLYYCTRGDLNGNNIFGNVTLCV